MLTATTASTFSTISNPVAPSHVENVPSAEEIASRVMAIRSKWDLSERIARRRMAEQRFIDLLDALNDTAHAA